ncbi:MAG: penicillin-binding protein 2 [Bacteroidales bacterium]|nr:penicillin-binding protein 2 [Bacteroidales bacterium]
MKDPFIYRKYVLITLALIGSVALLVRLFYVQVVDDSYRVSAESNVLRFVPQYPARGLIYDRNGKLIVFNQAAYDIMVIPGQTSAVDTASFCEMTGITVESFRERLRTARRYSRMAPSVFLKQISAETYATLQEKMYRFPGFYVQTRTLRNYARPAAAHILGYVGEVDDNLIKAEPYYRSGDYIGVTGIEKAYERELRGQKGVTIFLVDVHGRIKGSYNDGENDTIPLPGIDLISTIDIDLQEYGEMLMKNKSGSIVALEPSTGEVLALVSSPGYDPSLLVGRVRSENFSHLQADTLNPLFNRALMASYPPGSTFKPIIGLIALQEKMILPSTEFGCSPGYLFVGCHLHTSPLNLPEAIMHSCNSYFCQAFRRTLENGAYPSVSAAYQRWRKYLTDFGFGNTLNSDLSNELPGFIPETSYYDRYYGVGRWKALTVISLGIGQGEIGTTPLQMANMTAAIANRGFYYTPHIVRSADYSGDPNPQFTEKHMTGIDSVNFLPVIEGLDLVVSGGPGATARHISIPGISICGKTGTAQNPHGDDHSVFIAFAPKDNPKIAIAVYVENAGFGSTMAAPVASLMIEKYLTGEVKNKWREDNILSINLIDREANR